MAPIPSIKRGVARAIVSMYPTTWRRRYSADLTYTLESRDVAWRELADLLWCGVEEWSRADAGARERPTALALRAAVAIGTSFVVAIAVTGIGLVVFLTFVAAISLWAATNALEIFDPLLRGWMPLPIWFAWSLFFVLPAVALCTVAGVGRRWPLIARLLTTASFMAFTVWLPHTALPLPDLAQLGIAGTTAWVLAMVLFPTRHARRAASPRAAGMLNRERADNPPASPASSPRSQLRAFTT